MVRPSPPLPLIVSASDSAPLPATHLLLWKLGRGFARFVNVRDDHGATPLHLAARQGRPGCVQVLLENGAIVSALTGSYGYANLVLSAWCGRSPLAQSVKMQLLTHVLAVGAAGSPVAHRCIWPLAAGTWIASGSCSPGAQIVSRGTQQGEHHTSVSISVFVQIVLFQCRVEIRCGSDEQKQIWVPH